MKEPEIRDFLINHHDNVSARYSDSASIEPSDFENEDDFLDVKTFVDEHPHLFKESDTNGGNVEYRWPTCAERQRN